MDRWPRSKCRRVLRAVYSEYAPEKLDALDDVLDHFYGRIEDLVDTLEDKYGIQINDDGSFVSIDDEEASEHSQQQSDDEFIMVDGEEDDGGQKQFLSELKDVVRFHGSIRAANEDHVVEAMGRKSEDGFVMGEDSSKAAKPTHGLPLSVRLPGLEDIRNGSGIRQKLQRVRRPSTDSMFRKKVTSHEPVQGGSRSARGGHHRGITRPRKRTPPGGGTKGRVPPPIPVRPKNLEVLLEQADSEFTVGDNDLDSYYDDDNDSSFQQTPTHFEDDSLIDIDSDNYSEPELETSPPKTRKPINTFSHPDAKPSKRRISTPVVYCASLPRSGVVSRTRPQHKRVVTPNRLQVLEQKRRAKEEHIAQIPPIQTKMLSDDEDSTVFSEPDDDRVRPPLSASANKYLREREQRKARYEVSDGESTFLLDDEGSEYTCYDDDDGDDDDEGDRISYLGNTGTRNASNPGTRNASNPGTRNTGTLYTTNPRTRNPTNPRTRNSTTTTPDRTQNIRSYTARLRNTGKGGDERQRAHSKEIVNIPLSPTLEVVPTVDSPFKGRTARPQARKKHRRTKQKTDSNNEDDNASSHGRTTAPRTSGERTTRTRQRRRADRTSRRVRQPERTTRSDEAETSQWKRGMIAAAILCGCVMFGLAPALLSLIVGVALPIHTHLTRSEEGGSLRDWKNYMVVLSLFTIVDKLPLPMNERWASAATLALVKMGILMIIARFTTISRPEAFESV